MNIGRRQVLEAVGAATLGVVLTATAFYPGLMSFDSAVQFSQARGALPLDDVHPPFMVLLWRVCDRLIAGPGGLFLLFASAWWLGLASMLWQIDTTRPRRWLALFALGLWPATFLMLAHLWKDVGMTAALLLASAAALAWRRTGRGSMRVAALSALFVACAFRHNAVCAALPLLLWLLWPRAGEVRRWSLRGLSAVLLAGLLAATPGALARLFDVPRGHAWTVTAQWDLAAISIASGEMRLPASSTLPGTTPADLVPGYVPWACPPLFDLRKLYLSFYTPFSEAQLRDLLQAWAGAVHDHPGAYLAHRGRMLHYLLLGYPTEVPRDLVYVPQRQVRDDVSYVAPPLDTTAWPWRLAETLRTTPLFAGGVYLGLSLVALVWARRRRGVREPVFVLVASAWANAVPLAVISGSAEFRYLTWTVLAALLALALAALGSRRESA